MENYTLTPAGAEVLSALPLVIIGLAAVVLFVLTVLMPYYVYRSYHELRRIRHAAERWESWMRRQQP